MKNLWLTIQFLIMVVFTTAQPTSFKYQTVVRDGEGAIVPNQTVSFQLTILQGNPGGTNLYTETHTTTTNQFGIANLEIGNGTVVSGDFETIDWGSSDHFLEISFDIAGGTNYLLAGTSQLMAVPYALYAEDSGNDLWEKGENGIHFTEGSVGIGTDDPQTTLDVMGGTRLRANTTLGSGNWIGLYFNGYGNDDQPEWLFASHNEGGFQFRRWDGVDFSEHYLKVNEGEFRFGAYDCPPLKYHFNGWAHISDSLKVGSNNLFVGSNGKVGLGTNHPVHKLDVAGDINFTGELRQNGSPISLTDIWSTNLNGIHYDEGSVAIGTNNPSYHKLYVVTTATDSSRAVMHVRNNSSSTSAICNLYISAGESGSTYLNHLSDNYIHWGGRYASHSMLANNGKGLVFRTGENDQGRFAFEFRRELGSTYTYDEKVSITYDGKMGIGTVNPVHKLDIRDNTRFAVDVSHPNILKFGNLYSSYDTLRMASLGNVEVSLDDNNSSTDNSFRILKDNGTVELFKVTDSGDVLIDGVLVGNGGNGNSTTILGYNALTSNQSGNYLTALGSTTLYANTTGVRNTAVGSGALEKNTEGNDNTALGVWALYNSINGTRNTAMGYDAMFEHTEGSGNTSIGCFAGRNRNITNNGTFLGYNAYAGTNNLSNVTGIGFDARPTASNQVRIGNSSVTSIGGSVNWTIISDERYKVNLKEDVKGLDFILKLRPVTFNYAVNKIASFLSEDIYTDESGNTSVIINPVDKMSRDAKEMIRYTGFLAQEVEEVALQAGYDFSGVDKPMNDESLYGIRYAEFVVPLVKAIQEQQAIIETLKARIEMLENR